MSVNQEQKEKESNHIPIASEASQPILSCVTPLPDSNKIGLTMRDL